MQAAAVLGCLVQCSRARSAVWAAGGGSTLLPALLQSTPLALSGERPSDQYGEARVSHCISSCCKSPRKCQRCCPGRLKVQQGSKGHSLFCKLHALEHFFK